jgi:hypothetical protein
MRKSINDSFPCIHAMYWQLKQAEQENIFIVSLHCHKLKHTHTQIKLNNLKW